MPGTEEPTFGSFLKNRRVELNMSARELCRQLEISPIYICDLEKDRRPVTNDILHKLCTFLHLDRDSRSFMYDLAAKEKNTVSADLIEYIMGSSIVRAALRAARDYHIPDSVWDEFIRRIS